MRLLIFVNLFFVFSIHGLEAQVPYNRVRTFADSLRKNYDIPALAYSVIRSDTILLMDATGLKRKDKAATVSVNDYYHLGSNSKAITSFIAGRLVDAGKISWGTRVIDLFPSWKDSINKAYRSTSLAALMSHRAGIKPFTSGAEYLTLPNEVKKTGPSRRAFSKWLLQQVPVPRSDSDIVYSNAGYCIAALMLEKATGKTWEKLVDETLRGELKLRYHIGWPFELGVGQPYGHWAVKDSLVTVTPEYGYNLLDCVAPAGDISMPLADYSRFIQLMLREITGKGKYLKPETVQFIFYQLPKYSIGWGVAEENGVHISFHDGSAGTFFCHTVMYGEADLGIIVIANAGEQSTQEGIYMLERRLSTDYWTIKPDK